jgi:hypothetical protein
VAGLSQSLTASLKITLFPFSASCSVSPNPIPYGQGGTVTASGTGGYTPYQYQINSGPLSNVPTIAVFQSTPGTYTANVLVVDSQGQQANGSCNYQVSSPPPLVAGCSISPNPVSLGNGATVFGSASGGAGAYTYNINGAGYFSSSSALVMPLNGGTYTASISVKDSLGTVASGNCSATVQGVAPTITGFNFGSPHNRVNFSGTISGTAFTSSATVSFCVAGTNTCFQQPGGVSVFPLTSISVTGINLTTGSWQVEVITQYGTAKSAGSFSVLP